MQTAAGGEQWTDQAAAALATKRPNMTSSQWGTAVHKRIKDDFDALKRQFSLTYIDTFAERSYVPGVELESEKTPYGRVGSSRLDMIEIREQVVCIYDVKTGRSGIGADQLRRAAMIAAGFGKFTFYIVEVRPTP